MLPRVSGHRFCCAPFTNVANYRRVVGDELIDDIDALARELNGIRVCHINSTGFGGGVAELLDDSARRQAFGEAAREHVRRGYLLPRLLRDELMLIKGMINGAPAVTSLSGEERP